MGSQRMAGIPGFGIDPVAAMVGDDPEVLRLENLDTDFRPPEAALGATRDVVEQEEANSWLPFTGKSALREAMAGQLEARSGMAVDPATQVTITCGEGDAMLDALFVATDPGDEVILTDPTYAGMINRVRIAVRAPRLVPVRPDQGEWRLDGGALAAAVNDRTRAVFVASRTPTGCHLNDSGVGGDRGDLPRAGHVADQPGLDGADPVRRAALSPSGHLAGHGRPGHPCWLRHLRATDDWLADRLAGVPAAIAGDVARAHIYNGLTPGG